MQSKLLKDLSQVLENGQRNKAGFINPGHLAVLDRNVQQRDFDYLGNFIC